GADRPLRPAVGALDGRPPRRRRLAGEELPQLAEAALDTAADVVAELPDPVVHDAVVDEVPLLAPADDAGGGEHGEVLRGVLLRRPDRVGELLHRRLAGAETVEELDPRRL